MVSNPPESFLPPPQSSIHSSTHDFLTMLIFNTEQVRVPEWVRPESHPSQTCQPACSPKAGRPVLPATQSTSPPSLLPPHPRRQHCSDHSWPKPNLTILNHILKHLHWGVHSDVDSSYCSTFLAFFNLTIKTIANLQQYLVLTGIDINANMINIFV